MEEIKHNCGAWIAARVSRRREDPGCATSAASVRRAMLRCGSCAGVRDNVAHISSPRENSDYSCRGGLSFPFERKTDNGRESRSKAKPSGLENARWKTGVAGIT